MRVSSTAAEAANSNGNQQNSPALEQLRAAIEPNSANAESSATAVLEAGEGEPEEQTPEGPSPSELFDFDACHAEVEGEAQEVNEAPADQTLEADTETPPGPVWTITSSRTITPDLYDPIAECEEEIAETAERIVACSVEISELDAKLKQMKKSWKTASDELVSLHLRKADLLSDQREKEKREAEAATRVFTPVLDPTKPQTDLTNLTYRETGKGEAESMPAVATQEPATPDAPESTEAFHARIDAAFAPTQASTPTPEQEAWDRDFRAVSLENLDGLTPKIIEILEANQIRTVGDWQDVPARRGIEYTQLSGGGAKLTEARFEKIMDAMLAYMNTHPRPAAAVDDVAAVAPAVTESSSTVETVNTVDIDDI